MSKREEKSSRKSQKSWISFSESYDNGNITRFTVDESQIDIELDVSLAQTPQTHGQNIKNLMNPTCQRLTKVISPYYRPLKVLSSSEEITPEVQKAAEDFYQSQVKFVIEDHGMKDPIRKR